MEQQAADIMATATVPADGTPQRADMADRGLYDFESAAAAHFNRALLALAGQPGVRDRHEWAAFDRTAGAAESCGRAASRRRDSVAGLSDGTLAREESEYRTFMGDTGIEVDVRNVMAFARRLSQARAASQTVDLDAVPLADLVGDLLPDWYADWLQDEREGLRQTRLHALESLARGLCESGRYADAIQAALAALHLEPLRETAHQTLIEIHLAEGNWSEACRQFQRCQRLLREELGVEPSNSMRLLLDKRSGLPSFPAA